MPSEFQLGVELADRYVISEVIGTGGSGAVWKATDKQLNRPVALKRLFRQATGPMAEEILEEARRSAGLIHQNIVQIYDVLEDGDDTILVMEFVDGQSLWALLRQLAKDGLTLRIGAVGDVLRGVLHGVSHAHRKNVCHRDLSPMNILIASDGVPKIADFGIAKVIRDTDATDTTSESPQGGTGNPQFMSPEQARGEPADFTSDLFMVGIMGYLILTGRHPFAHPTGLFSIAELIKDPDYLPQRPTPGSSLSEPDRVLYREYAAFVERLLRREKSARFKDALEAIAALEAAVPGLECSNCGTIVPESFKFCGECGDELKRAEVVRVGVAEVVRVADVSEADTAEMLEERGYEASRGHKWELAIGYYREAIRRDSTYQKAYANLGYALNHLGQYEEAIEVLSKGLELGFDRPEHRARFLYMRSYAHGHLKQYEQALEDIVGAVSVQPDSSRYLYQRAQLLWRLGRIEDARHDLEHILLLEPYHAKAQSMLEMLDRY